MDYGVVTPLSPVDVFTLARRMIVDKGSQVLFKSSIDNFGLAIRLRMVRQAHFEFCAVEFEEFTPKVAYKNRVSVGHKTARKSIKLAEHGGKKFNCLEGNEERWKKAKMGGFQKAIYND